MARILIVSHYAKSLLNFRGELIKKMVELGHEVVALGPEAGFEEKLKDLGAGYIQIPLERTGLNPLRDISTLLALVLEMRKLKPDVVFSYAVKPVIYGSLAARAAGVPAVYSMITGVGSVFLEESGRYNLLARLVKLLYKAALRSNHVVFFQNPDDLLLFKKKCLLPSDCKAVLVNGSGVNVQRFSYVEPPLKPISFLLVARLIYHKGIREYVEAARLLKTRYPEVLFKLLGPLDTNPSAIGEKELETWVNEGVIEYLGETDDVRPYLAACSVYVLPSYREGTPRSVLEAMAVGRPVITTDVPGCRETVKDGVNGFLVPVKNSVALAEAMERFILNPEMIVEMGKKSREIAEQKYDVHKVNRVILEAMGLKERV
ncbi:MAG TPA: glycosyltransferase family 4 protein [Syntrophothermus lipocalidus]|nr:glycosyltransferase family 4 protein [Syntrophothermus lipocalidus]